MVRKILLLIQKRYHSASDTIQTYYTAIGTILIMKRESTRFPLFFPLLLSFALALRENKYP